MNSNTINGIIPVIQGYFATQPISKAWLFGSYSRGEETTGSDVDILVSKGMGYYSRGFACTEILVLLAE